MFRLLQGVFASMSLERKSLLFFGSALLLLMSGAFWIVQLIAGSLVINSTRQVARDYGAAMLMGRHYDAEYAVAHERATGERGSAPEFQAAKARLDELQGKFINPKRGFSFDVLGLGDPVAFDNLPEAPPPEDPEERRLLVDLEQEFRQTLASWIETQRPDLQRTLDLQENEAFRQLSPGAPPVFRERTSMGDQYIHYVPVFSLPECLGSCHSPRGQEISFSADGDPRALAAQYPFRVAKVTMPYAQTHELTTWIRAVVIAVAMLIIAVTLFVLHAIVRYLVLRPLYHLRDVSDAITHGDTQLRATIETEDEFRELADAFNRMLRHLTETQDQLREVNREMDQRVDQLAQLNLQLYEANRLKSDFLANMSHELRTPLNSIIGFSDVLHALETLPEKQRRYAGNIRKSGRILLEMINDILDLAKMEAGKMEVRRTRFDLAPLVHAQADMVRSLSEEKNIGLSVEIPAGLPEATQDQGKIGQVLTNLLSNAIKFTPQGGLITVRVADLENGRFQLSVADTGIGIAKEDQVVIFEKFRQSRAVLQGDGLTREYSGTGLGLSIVKELCKLLGGEISFESELGRGSTFVVTLPWTLPLPSSPPPSAPPVGSGASGESIGTEALHRQLEP